MGRCAILKEYCFNALQICVHVQVLRCFQSNDRHFKVFSQKPMQDLAHLLVTCKLKPLAFLCLLTSELDVSASFTLRSIEHLCHHMKSGPVHAFYLPKFTEFYKQSCKMASKSHSSPEKYARSIFCLTKPNRNNVCCGAKVPGKHQHSDSFFQSTILNITVSSSHLIRN